jgi:hypothetical protein
LEDAKIGVSCPHSLANEDIPMDNTNDSSDTDDKNRSFSDVDGLVEKDAEKLDALLNGLPRLWLTDPVYPTSPKMAGIEQLCVSLPFEVVNDWISEKKAKYGKIQLNYLPDTPNIGLARRKQNMARASKNMNLMMRREAITRPTNFTRRHWLH